jgi:DNA-binding transcriptional MocR family regulator
MISCIEESFPPETGVSRPRGGSVVWLELPGGMDSERLFDAAIGENISIVPGGIFSAGQRYRNFIRLSYGHPWNETIENGIATLGRLVHNL